MTQDKFTDAITELDSDILERYVRMKNTLAEKKKPKQRAGVKWASLAACLCLIITASIVVLPSIIDDIFTGTGESNFIHFADEAVKGECGTITLTEENLTEYKCTFILEKTNDKPICFAFRGYTVLREYLDENGAVLQEVQNYHIITPYDNYKEAAINHIVVDDKLIVTVNGVQMDNIPTAPGTYEITIDYSELENILDRFEPFVDVVGFGTFVLDNELYGK